MQVLTILQYGIQELGDYLRELSYENPLVELIEPLPEQKPLPRRMAMNSGAQLRENLSSPSDETLQAFLNEQLLSLSLTDGMNRVIRILIELLDDHGFFDGNLSELARLACCDMAAAQAALDTLRTMEPIGVGAGSVREYLQIQLQQLPKDTAVAEALLALEERGSRAPAQLAAALHTSLSQVEEAMQLLASLHPYPSDGFATNRETIYIQPDLYIFTDETGIHVHGSESGIPQISINQEYLAMLDSPANSDLQPYLRQKLRQAQQVMYGMDNRKSTILRCGEVIAEQQSAFFYGRGLQKLTLRDVAEELGVHESTVSRAVKNKYIQCDRGLFPMRFFFSRSVGNNVSLCREAIQEALEQCIAEEDAVKPYSDQQLVHRLEQQGITISRRAVAKYRTELKIPPACLRKRQRDSHENSTCV